MTAGCAAPGSITASWAARCSEHASLQAFTRGRIRPARRLWGVSTRGTTPLYRSGASLQAGDAFLFGPETRGLPDAVLGELGEAAVLRLPMASHSRSLNLSNTVAVLVYEAWRQQGFQGSAD